MAEDSQSNDDRTEDATPERREEFREKGQIAVSREVTSVLVLASMVGFFSFYAPAFILGLRKLFVSHFERISDFRVTTENFFPFSIMIAEDITYLIMPFFLVTMSVAIMSTLLQTRFNFSWTRLKPDFSRMNPLKGLARLVSLQAVVELTKGIGKMSAVGIVAYLILRSEWTQVPGLMNLHLVHSWSYWADITQNLFWGVAVLLVAVAGLDYFYNFMSLEKKLKMTKQEVKEEYKRREVDPHIKNRIRRMQREMSNRRMMEATKDATVIITNPTHYSIALRYEIGMAAPVVVAKGKDHLALKMREVAGENDIPLVENKPLARTLYKVVEIGGEIPESLYKAVSEIIKYVFKLKGFSLSRQT